jgi:hypothetical protein
MTGRRSMRVSDLRGVGSAALDATRGLIDLVDTVQHTIPRGPGILGLPTGPPPQGISGLVSRAIREVTGLFGGGIDVALEELARVTAEARTWQEVEAVLAALNGVLGDYLAETGNPLAIEMELRRGGGALPMEPRALRWALPKGNEKLLLLVHGFSMNDLQWNRNGHDHGAALERDCGWLAVYLHYNSGLHVSVNGRAFTWLLEALLADWPVVPEEIAIVAHGMGGLVARSACHAAAAAGHRWLAGLRRMVFLGTPHHGTRGRENAADVALGPGPYRAPFGRLGRIRSAGLSDLRRGNLLDEDGRRVKPVPLPAGVDCFAIGAVRASDSARAGRAAGDGLVPLESALGRHADRDRALDLPEPRTWVGAGMSHLDLLSRPEVYEVLARWLSGPVPG